MADFRKIRDLVQFTDDRFKVLLEDDIMVGFSKDDEDTLYCTEEELVGEYTKESGLKYSQVVRLLKASKKYKYLIPSPTGSNKIMVNPKEGYNLLEKKVKIPIGIVREFLNENGKFITLVVGIIVAIATVINVIIATYKP